MILDHHKVSKYFSHFLNLLAPHNDVNLPLKPRGLPEEHIRPTTTSDNIIV